MLYSISRHYWQQWRLFSFILENLVNKTNKGDNEYQKLNQISICNIHWHRPPFFRTEGQPLRKWRVSRLALWFPTQEVYHTHVLTSITICFMQNQKAHCFLKLPMTGLFSKTLFPHLMLFLYLHLQRPNMFHFL